jgi:hypothetical protein
MKHIALLRGMNVGGTHGLAMSELIGIFEEGGCRGIRTYIQSWDVVIEASSLGLEAAKKLSRMGGLVSLEAWGLRHFFEVGADFPEFWEEGVVDDVFEVVDAGGAAGAAFEPDDALDDLHMPESPEGLGLVDVDELLRHFVGVPVGVGVLIDPFEREDDARVHFVLGRDVAVEHLIRDLVPVAREEAKALVIKAWGAEGGLDGRVDFGGMREDREHSSVLVPEHELDEAVLVRLDPARGAQDVAELHILARRERGEDGPLREELVLDVFDASEHFERRFELVVRDQAEGLAQLVDDEFEPELCGLVLDDEEEFVVVLGA